MPRALHGSRRPLVAAFLLAAAGLPAGAQEPVRGSAAAPRDDPIDPQTAPRPVLRAVAADGKITIDGRLDEPAWSRADVAGDFVQNQPRPGYPATQKTEVRIIYDFKNLYIGAIMFDTDMDRVLIPGMERDFNPRDGDVFALAIDPFHDKRNSFVFISNPRGAERDEQTFDNSRQVISAWDGVWQAEATRNDSAWIVEMRIPFATLRFDGSKPIQDWGINFARIVGRHNEWSYWAPLARHEILHKMARAGVLTGLQGIEPGRNLKIKPYALGAASSGTDVPAEARGGRWDGGLDLKYGLTPGLTLDLTYNTDFAQVEADEEQVNLTRFSLFFSEQRDFFNENQGTFSFGDQSERGYRLGASRQDLSLFHSRRVGLTDDGRRIPIYGGGRVSGRMAGFGVGAFTIQTEATGELPSENFTVVRLKRDLLGESDVGFIVINRQGGGHNNRSYGADANLRLLDHLILHMYAAGTRGPGEVPEGGAAKLGAAWRDAFWNVSFFVKEVGSHFRPEVGFVRRTGMRHHYGTLGIHHQPASHRLQEVNPYVEVDYITDLSSTLESRRVTGALAVTLGSSAQLSAEVTDRFERLREPFRILGGKEIPVGQYAFREATLAYSLPAKSNLRGGASVTLGGFWDGRRRSIEASGSWRPRYDLFLDLSLERNEIDLPRTEFTADIVGLRVRYASSTSLFWSAFVQYNAQTHQLVTNLRGQFRYAPLSDIYLVFTERQDLEGRRSLDRSVALKVTRMLSL